MDHDPEVLAATYLSDMPPRARARHEQHLLTCETCWREVSLARRGRELAEIARQAAPAGLREHLRASIAATEPTAESAVGDHPGSSVSTRVRRPRLTMAIATLGLAAALVAAFWQPWQHSVQPPTARATSQPALDAALASFRTDQLPGTAVPPQPAPDLTPLGLRLVAAGAGHLGQADVAMYAYRAASGARLAVYRSSQPFPEADEAHEVPGAEPAWTLQSDGITILCGPDTHTMLLLSTDPKAVHQVGEQLDLT
jgi:4-amino-4-deoxy-L-arabinose transferase-like glycosyltransferase